jgi:hypothetical protein
MSSYTVQAEFSRCYRSRRASGGVLTEGCYGIWQRTSPSWQRLRQNLTLPRGDGIIQVTIVEVEQVRRREVKGCLGGVLLFCCLDEYVVWCCDRLRTTFQYILLRLPTVFTCRHDQQPETPSHLPHSSYRGH